MWGFKCQREGFELNLVESDLEKTQRGDQMKVVFSDDESGRME